MEYETFPNVRDGWDGMDGEDDDCYWSFIDYERVPPLHSIFIHSGNINLKIYKNEKIVNRNESNPIK